jgi:curved DNA-binding protein CbpA
MTAGATYYDILRVNRQATPDGVRCAYRKLAQRYHPDKLRGSPDAVRVMAMLNEAYSVLSDPDKRASYDLRMERVEARTAGARKAFAPALREASWPWYLLFATIAFAAASVGTVAYNMAVTPIVAPVAAGTPK